MSLDGTLSGLKLSIADWLHRTDLADSLLDDLVYLTEDVINNGDPTQDIPALRTSAQESALSLTTSANVNTVTLPTDYVKLRGYPYVIGPGNVKQELKRGATIPIMQSDRAQITGLPQWFYETGQTLYTIPMSDQSYQLKGTYYAKLPSLVANTAGNWLSLSYPRIYLFGCCMFAGPWLGTDNRIQLWASGFKSGIAGLNKADKRKRITDELARTEISDVLAPGPYNIYTGLYL